MVIYSYNKKKRNALISQIYFVCTKKGICHTGYNLYDKHLLLCIQY